MKVFWRGMGGGAPVRQPGGATSLLLAVLLAAVPVVPQHNGGEARAEILVLKADGERIPCRVLYKDEEKIVVRVGVGAERTVLMSEVAEVLPDTSNVEVYEGVAEAMPSAVGIVPYYLGVWCLKNGLPQNGRLLLGRLLGRTAGDRSVAARAKLALAEALKGAGRRYGEQRALLLAAVMADPTLEEAVEALSGEEHEPVEIPPSILMGLVRAIDNVRGGFYKSAYGKLLSIKKKAGPEVLQALSLRLITAAGVSFEEFMARCGKGPGPRPFADPQEGGWPEHTGCRNCGGSGFILCEVCGGQGYIVCRQCRGSGKITTTKTELRVGVGGGFARRRASKKCPSCGGKGYRECGACIRERNIATRKYDMRMRASGWRRCPLCNKDGKISFFHVSDQTALTTYARGRTPVRREFANAQLQGMRKLASALVSSTGRAADRFWRGGGKVPLQVVPRPEGSRMGASGPEGTGKTVFVGGKWVTPSMARLMKQRMKTLKYEPRKPDLGPFVSWLRDEEIAFLRGHSVDIGAGQYPVASILGIASQFERAQGANYLDAFDRAQVFRTVFLPDFGTDGGGVACGWRVVRSRGREAVTLVLLRDPGRWPGLEMVLTPDPRDGLDMDALGKDLVSHSRQPLVLYYRLASCRRSSKGRGDDAVSQVALDVRVAAAIVGPERRPKKVWIHGVEALTQSVAGR